MKLINKLFVAGLIISVLLDPGNTLFHSKEVFFILVMVSGFFMLKKPIPNGIVRKVLFISVFLPVWGITIGFLIGNEFDFEIALGFAKALLFFISLLVLFPYGKEYSQLFSMLTLLIIPLTGIIYYLYSIGGPYLIPRQFGEDTLVVSRRSFGPLLIDPVIFYKTCPLLVFGLSYVLSTKSRIVHIIGTCLIVGVLFISGTRANMLSGTIIILFHLYHRSRKTLKHVLVLILILVAFIYLPYVLHDVFFAKGETSMDIKQGRINACVDFWVNNPTNFLLGSGIGSGFLTPEGFQYLTENTYLEIIRYWGILLAPIVFITMLVGPIKLLFKYRKYLPEYAIYFFIAFSTYAFIEVPSNPLLISSTGMIVIVMAYSLAYSLKSELDGHNPFINV